MCRYERRARVPNLETLLAYECLFGAPTAELYAGLYPKGRKEYQAAGAAPGQEPRRGGSESGQ